MRLESIDDACLITRLWARKFMLVAQLDRNTVGSLILPPSLSHESIHFYLMFVMFCSRWSGSEAYVKTQVASIPPSINAPRAI